MVTAVAVIAAALASATVMTGANTACAAEAVAAALASAAAMVCTNAACAKPMDSLVLH